MKGRIELRRIKHGTGVFKKALMRFLDQILEHPQGRFTFISSECTKDEVRKELSLIATGLRYIDSLHDEVRLQMVKEWLGKKDIEVIYMPGMNPSIIETKLSMKKSNTIVAIHRIDPRSEDEYMRIFRDYRDRGGSIFAVESVPDMKAEEYIITEEAVENE